MLCLSRYNWGAAAEAAVEADTIGELQLKQIQLGSSS